MGLVDIGSEPKAGREFKFLVKFRTLICLSLLTVVFLCSSLDLAFAQSKLSVRPKGFTVDDNVQGKIDFWKLVFSKYGENHLVFHHREHPQIIYSVLDLSEYKREYSGKELSQRTKQAIGVEVSRIKDTLTKLASGESPDGPYERRIFHLFQALPGSILSNIREANTDENIRNQRGVRDLFRKGLERSGRYLYAIERVFAREGLPLEITRLPLVESSFDYTAYSSVGAAGIWQFMRETGKKYMRIDSLMDERKDPITASRAAAKYLSSAYERIGSWPLAITSYNHGVAGVLRAINQAGSRNMGVIIANYKGESFGFASKNFYAEFMAALEVEQNSLKYFPDLKRESPWYFDEIRLTRSINFMDVCRATGTTKEELEKLNEAFLTPILSGRANIPAGSVIKVPPGKGEALLSRAGGGEIVKFEDDLVLPAKSIGKAESNSRSKAVSTQVLSPKSAENKDSKRSVANPKTKVAAQKGKHKSTIKTKKKNIK